MKIQFTIIYNIDIISIQDIFIFHPHNQIKRIFLKQNSFSSPYFFLFLIFFKIWSNYMIPPEEIHAKIFRDYEIHPGWMKQTYLDIKTGAITLKDAAKNVPVRTILGYSKIIQIDPKTLSRKFAENGIKVFEIGRKGFNPIPDDDLIAIIKTISDEIHSGITKIWERANKEGVSISHEKVTQICQKKLGFPTKIPRPKPLQRCRYLISQVNGVWHGDIHYITLNNQEIKYLFALLDDRSRFIVGWGLYDQKNSQAVISTFQAAIENIGETPLIYWSDNGGENRSDLTRHFLRTHNIHQIFTTPSNPQQNGKMERWWRKLDEFLHNATTWDEVFTIIEYYVNIYNYSIPHHGLEKVNGFHCYPFEVFSNRYLQKTTIDDCKIIIDGKHEIPLSEFGRQHEERYDPKPNIYDIYSLLN